MEILRGLTIQPRVILAEAHGIYDAPTDLIASLLEKRGYKFHHEMEFDDCYVCPDILDI